MIRLQSNPLCNMAQQSVHCKVSSLTASSHARSWSQLGPFLPPQDEAALPFHALKASVLMQRLSYSTETVLSNKITREYNSPNIQRQSHKTIRTATFSYKHSEGRLTVKLHPIKGQKSAPHLNYICRLKCIEMWVKTNYGTSVQSCAVTVTPSEIWISQEPWQVSQNCFGSP